MNTPRHLALLCLLACLLVLPARILSAQSSEPPAYEIGQIPSLRVWYSADAQVSFIVQATVLGAGTTLSASFDPADGIAGSRTFDPATGAFLYVPAAGDAESFVISFQAVNATNSVPQTVTITPLRPLPAESSVFGLLPKGALPLDDSRDFMDVTERTVSGTVWFNAQNRASLRDIVIVGKAVVFEPGHANSLWNYHDNDDLRTMSIHAETLVIRGALRLPATNLEIYATEVRFEDQDGQPAASITTTPRASSAQPAQFANGRPGHNGGSLTLFADAITGAGSTPRFILTGGNGERAGQGRRGTNGANRSVVHEIKNGIYGFKWTDNNTIYAFFDGLINTSAGSTTWPGDGGDATPGGRPGTAGDGGSVTSNLTLAAWTSNSGGRQGTVADFQSGGTGGTPRQAWRRYYTSDGLQRYDERFSSNGSGASGPNSTKITGSVGSVNTLPGDLRWLDPLALQKVLIYVRRAYLAQHFDYTRETLTDYVGLLDAAMASTAWTALSLDARTDLAQILDEMRGLLARIESNLDYFGNPAGWVPMLSFEVNKLAFDNEIPRALRIMYLNHWLGNRATTLQQKTDAMTKLRTEVRDQVAADRAAYATAIAAIPGLEFQAREVQDRINQTKTDIETLKNDLLPKAKNIALLKKTARTLGAVAEIFPVGQPYVGVAGSTLSRATEIDPDAPWTENTLILGTHAAGSFASSGANGKAQAVEGAAGDADVEAASQQVTVEQLQTLQKPVLDLLGETINQVRQSQSPTPEVEAELQRLMADEPAYRVMLGRIRSLNADKARFVSELTQTMQTVVRLSSAITRGLLTIDRLNRAIQANSLVLNPETLAYLSGMNERARERLLKYHYFMARAYEYRLLKPYEGDLDLNAIVDRFVSLAADPQNPGSTLTAEQFASLQAVYEDQVSAIAFGILTEYNSNRPTLSAPVRLTLPQDMLDQINAGGSPTINLEDEGLFLPSQENVRIVDLRVIDLQVTYTGSRDDVFYGDVIFQHAGTSRLQKEGESYLFRHYNEDTRSKLEWSTRFDPYDGSLDPVQPSAADQSLLKALLSTGSSSPSTDDLLLYSRPAADADLTIFKDVNARGGAGFTITSMRIELTYDFTRMSDQIRTLKVAGATDGPQPRVAFGAADRNGRTAGEGSFTRAFDIGTTVAITADEQIGQYRFDHWEGAGIVDPTSAATTVSMSASREVRPVYKLIALRTLTVSGGTGSGEYSEGDVVPIAAAVPAGQRFVRWEGATVADAGAAQTTVIVTADTTVRAIYEAIGSFSALVNISNRALVGTGADILIPGFVIQGTGTKRILVRAVGPSLARFGVAGTLADPQMSLYRRQPGTTTDVIVAANDNWGTNANAAEIVSTSSSLGAFSLTAGSADAALLLDVQPGQYSVVASGVGDTTGVAIVEVYDADASQADARLVNISGRARVGVGDQILIPGFVVEGDAPRRFLIRAVGPSLARFGVGGTLADPALVIYKRRPGTTIDDEIARNDNWGDAANAAQVVSSSSAVGAFSLLAGSADAAVLIDLEPGAYTAAASGVGATTGVALVEVYEVTE